MKAYEICVICTLYAAKRADALVPALARESKETGETSQQVLDRYMSKIHELHESGVTISGG